MRLFRKSCLLSDNVKNVAQTDGQATHDNITGNMRFACWMTNATDTHSECVITAAFPQQQRLHEGVSLLPDTHRPVFKSFPGTGNSLRDVRFSQR